MDMITVTAKTVDEAVTKALIELETTSDKLEYEVVEKGSAGFLGIGAKPAIIRAKKKVCHYPQRGRGSVPACDYFAEARGQTREK